MRPANPLALMVIGHAALLAAVHLHVGGVPVDHYRPAGQRRRPLRGQHVHHRGGHCRQTVSTFSHWPGVTRRASWGRRR